MPRQSPLFSDHEADGSAPPTPANKTGAPGSAVTALQFTSASLSPEQRRFIKLITRTANLARKMEAAAMLADAHRPHHGATLRPLEDERSALMRHMTLWLDAHSDESLAAQEQSGTAGMQEQQQAQDAQGALRTNYRQRVGALHPGRESDSHERRDLLALTQLQVRAALADGEMVADLAPEKVAALSVLLRERADVLTR